MSTAALSLEAVQSSNLPSGQKSAIRRFYDRISGSGAMDMPTRVMGHARQGANIIRFGGEAAITGGLLGLIDAEVGLDGGPGGIPWDGWAAGAGFAAAFVMANDPLGVNADLCSMATDSLTILTYRKTKAWRERSKGVRKTSAAAAHGEDPILAVASEL